jgi:N-acylneuraminate cytidylyltransferase
MSAIAIIPARGGSKRIPRKNIKPFCGKPIIAYSIETAIKSNCFDEVMVSTDDDEIAIISQSYGASVPFKRSEKTSNDYAGILEVIEEVINKYISSGKTFDAICCLLPTAPLISKEDLIEAQKILLQNNFDSVFPVVSFSYPILRALQIDGNKISMIWPENDNKRSQDLPPAYHDAGQFYWMNNQCFKKQKIFTDNSGFIILPEIRVQDIDSQDDWDICELKYRRISV